MSEAHRNSDDPDWHTYFGVPKAVLAKIMELSPVAAARMPDLLGECKTAAHVWHDVLDRVGIQTRIVKGEVSSVPHWWLEGAGGAWLFDPTGDQFRRLEGIEPEAELYIEQNQPRPTLRKNLKPPGVVTRAVERVAGPGDCYPAAEVVYHAAGGKKAGLTPAQVEHEGQSHWFVRGGHGKVYDPTADQFETPVPYDEAVGRGFLTKKPSRRGKAMAREAGLRLNGFGVEQARRLGEAINALAPEAAEKIVKGMISGGKYKRPITSFKDGGCYILARALARWAGPSAEVLGLWIVDYENFEDSLDHVVLRIGDWFFDQDGASTERDIIEHWRYADIDDDLVTVERDGRLVACVHFDQRLCSWLGSFTSQDLRRFSYRYPPGKIYALEALIRERLGDPSSWGIDQSRVPQDKLSRFHGRPRDWSDEEFERVRKGLS